MLNFAQRLSSNFFSASAFSNPPETILETMACLGGKLNEWGSSLPHNLRPSVHAMLDVQPRNSRRKQNIIRLHYLYYSSVIALSANIHYPWVTSVLLN